MSSISSSLHSKAIGHTTRKPAKDLVGSFTARILLLGLVHIPLVITMRSFPQVATLHAILTLLIGLVFALRDTAPYRVIYVAAYITGAEVLWRMTDAAVFWEYAKYSVSLLFIVTLFKQKRIAAADLTPVLFMALLVPSIAFVPGFNREDISSNLSGPFSLAVAALFFSTLRLTRSQAGGILLAIIIPLIGTAFLITTSILSLESITFGRSSNSLASGGFGPNQVSAALGLGALCAFLYLFTSKKHVLLQLVCASCGLWFLGQASLTFSRGGVWTALAGMAMAGLYLLRDRRARIVLLLSCILAAGAWSLVIFPFLDNFTGGMLAFRYASTTTSGREFIFGSDLIAFQENPFTGIGVGQTRAFRNIQFSQNQEAHIEYSRLLAEHGVFGLAAMGLLALLTLKRLRVSRTPIGQAFSSAFTVWALLYMVTAAMRLVAPGFLFGLAGAPILDDEEIE